MFSTICKLFYSIYHETKGLCSWAGKWAVPMHRTLLYSCADHFHADVQHTSIQLCNTVPRRCAAYLCISVQHTSCRRAEHFKYTTKKGSVVRWCWCLLSIIICPGEQWMPLQGDSITFFFAENIKFIYAFLIPYQASQLPENKITTVTQNGFELLIQFCLNENWYNYIVKMMTNDLRLLIFLSWNFTILIDRVEIKASENHFLRKYLASLFIKFQSVNNPRFIKGAILRLFMDVIAFWNEVLEQRKQCSYDTIMLNGRK